MKIATLMLALVAGLMFSTSAVNAQEDAPEGAAVKKATDKKKKKVSKKADKTPLSAVGKALKKVKYVTGKKADPKATHYIYLVSASWCGPCNAEMPKVVEQYKEMSTCGVELILVSGDHDTASASGFMKKYGADFPCVMGDTERLKLPGWKDNNSIPFANIVDAEGKSIASGQAGAIIGNWKQTTGK